MWRDRDVAAPTHILPPPSIWQRDGSNWAEHPWLSRDYWIVPKSGWDWSADIFLETSSSSVTVLKTGPCHEVNATARWNHQGGSRGVTGVFEDPRVESIFLPIICILLEQVTQPLWISSLTQITLIWKSYCETSVRKHIFTKHNTWYAVGSQKMFRFFLPHFHFCLSAACLWSRNKT